MKNPINHSIFYVIIFSLFLGACGSSTSKKRNLDQILYKYAAVIRWSNFDAAVNFLKPGVEEIKPSKFEINHLKQFKVSRYTESPIRPGSAENIVLQDVEVEIYNIHNNTIKVIYDRQSWEYDDNLKQWFLTTGLPKL